MSNGTAIYVDNELFLGRLDEQERFRDALRSLLAGVDKSTSPYIFLLHGGGGMGKSQLTRRLHDIALYEPPFESSFHVLRVDWEQVRFHTPSLRVPRKQIHPESALELLYQVALDRRWGRQFSAYRQAIKMRSEIEEKVAKAIDGVGAESPYAPLRDLGARGLAMLIRQVLPIIGEPGEKAAEKALGFFIQGGAEAVAALRRQGESFLRDRLDERQYELYSQPHDRLARALGAGFAHVARRRPIVLIQDTYEIIANRVDPWMRQVIHTAGPRVLWVIAGRQNLASSRARDRFVGYRAEFPRHLAALDVGELAINYVHDYLRDRAPDRETSREDAMEIQQATLGVPLALRQAGDLWAEGVALRSITEGIPDDAPRQQILRLMTERVLLHVEEGPAGEQDRRAFYLLAMQPRPDAQVQAAVLDPGERAFDLQARLAQLSQRYAGIELAGGARLHDAVNAFLQEYLLKVEALSSATVKSIAREAVGDLSRRRGLLEKDLPSRADRANSQSWRQVTLDLVHWLFWADQTAAWRELIPDVISGLVYTEDFAHALLAIALPFRPALDPDGLLRLERLDLDENKREVLLDQLQTLTPLPKDGAQDELRAILELQRALWHVRENRHGEAFTTLQVADKLLPPQLPQLQEQIARAYELVGEHFAWQRRDGQVVDSLPSRDAKNAISRALSLGRETADLHHTMAAVLWRLQELEEALLHEERAVELNPDIAHHHNGLGSILHELKRYDEALVAYQTAIELEPAYAPPHNGLGNLYFALGRHNRAIEAFQRALQIDPDLAHAHNGLGNAYHALGRRQEALAAYQTALRFDPEHPHAHNGLGYVYHDLGRNDEALVAFRSAIRLNPESAAPYNGLGNILHDLGRSAEAITAFRTSIQIDPQVALPHNGLGNVYRDLDRSNEAIDAYQKAIALDPEFKSPHYNLGNTFSVLGRHTEAIEAYRSALQIDPDLMLAHLGLAREYATLESSDESKRHLERARKLAEPGDQYNQACLEAIAGDKEAALERLALALLAEPGLHRWASRDPDLTNLHDEPGFWELVQ